MFPLTLPLLPLFIKKGSVKKRKTRTNRSRFFEIALNGRREREWKGGVNENFAWKRFDYLMLLSC